MQKINFSKFLLVIFCLGVVLMSTSCKKDDDPVIDEPDYTIPTTYNFDNVSYSGQTQRIGMLTEMKAYMRSNMKIIEFAIKKWKLLILIGLIAGVFAAVFSMPEFISPKFKSEAVIYPANLGQYAEETGLEQMQQYLESNEIRNYIISKFNLYDEYEIDSTVRSSKTAIYKVYAEHISFDETKYESIRITVLSTDPVKAKEIIDEIIDQLNVTIRKVEREK